VLVLAFDPVARIMPAFRDLGPTARILYLSASDESATLTDLGLDGAVRWTADPAEIARAIVPVAGGRGYLFHGTPERGLTERELTVLRLVERGLKNRAIAQRLQTSRRTVEFHLSNVFAKPGAGSRTATSRGGAVGSTDRCTLGGLNLLTN
jgi:DNA-binding NarL/FixJ family response regulator